MRLAAALACAAALAAGTLAGAGDAEAGRIRGRVQVTAGPAPAPRANPYPGRAGALASPGAPVGGSGEAVIWVDALPPSVAVPPPSVRRPAIEQKGQAFVPRVLAVQAGTTVDFPNRDPIFHNVFSVSPAKRFDLGKYPRGQSRRVTFAKPGLVNVFCDIHSDMAAWVMVIAHHAFTQPEEDGRFVLPELPAGRYLLKAWHPDRGESHRSVDVPADGDATVDLHL